jgi:hypothetical protein
MESTSTSPKRTVAGERKPEGPQNILCGSGAPGVFLLVSSLSQPVCVGVVFPLVVLCHWIGSAHVTRQGVQVLILFSHLSQLGLSCSIGSSTLVFFWGAGLSINQAGQGSNFLSVRWSWLRFRRRGSVLLATSRRCPVSVCSCFSSAPCAPPGFGPLVDLLRCLKPTPVSTLQIRARGSARLPDWIFPSSPDFWPSAG